MWGCAATVSLYPIAVSRGLSREGGEWKRRQSITTSKVSTGEIIKKIEREMEQLAAVFTEKGEIFRVS